MKMLCFKFEQYRTINEQFDIFEGKGGRGLKFELLINQSRTFIGMNTVIHNIQYLTLKILLLKQNK